LAGDAARTLVASVERRRRQIQEGGPVRFHPLADRRASPAQNRALAIPAALRPHGVQRAEITRPGDRNHEVPPGVANHALDLALVIPLSLPAEAVLEKIMRLQAGEHRAELAHAIAEDLRHRQPRGVVEDRQRNPPKKAKAATCPSQNASAACAGYAFTNIASLCGRSTTRKRTFRDRPSTIAHASPKSA
jgi:hypothetical protein